MMAHNQADDLTAERAAIYKYHKVFDGYNFLSGPKGMEEIVGHDMELVTLDDHLEALKTARQEALREAAKVAREQTVCVDPKTDIMGTVITECGVCRNKTANKIADQLDRLASEGG